VTSTTAQRQFRLAYGAHRAAEGRSADRVAMLTLPYLAVGPLARQWSVRARTFEAFVGRVVSPMSQDLARALRVLDMGAGNGWLSWRLARAGHHVVAVDIRTDDVDGLGSARVYLDDVRFERVAASFEDVPLESSSFDLVVFNASLHYALDLRGALSEAQRMASSGGRIVILDSPFYSTDADGAAMVAEKRSRAKETFGDNADALMSLPFIEFLTASRLERAHPECSWTRHRVRYPLWYESRAVVAKLRSRRAPSRFDLWETVVA
jgi:SAM-dependent methyltransferase